MTLRLRDADRRAVDLLLDRAASGPGTFPGAHAGNGNANGDGHAHGGAGFTQASGDVQSRLPAVQKLLHVLDMMPAEQPPQDLLARTLRFVDSASTTVRDPLLIPGKPALGTPMHLPHA